MEKYKTRNSNIELLRIFMMISIILHHSIAHSSISFSQINNINFNIMYILQVLGKVANNVFIIITGYYMVNKKIKLRSIIKLFLETIFYSYFILILYLLFTKEINIDLIIYSIFPILTNVNWFITVYLLLYISIPVINILIDNLDKKKLCYVIIFMTIFFSILPTISLLKSFFSEFIWFIFLYLIGAYLRKYTCKELYEHNKLILLVSIIAVIISLLLKWRLNIYCLQNEINNFFILMLSISLFINFSKIKERNNGIINYIASSVLGVYLIHDNIIIRTYLWKIININKYLSETYFFIYEFCVVMGIFIVCIFIDKIRQYIIEKPVFKLIEKITKRYNRTLADSLKE